MKDSNIFEEMRLYIEKIKTQVFLKYYNPKNFNEELYEGYRAHLEKLEDHYPQYIQKDSPSFIIGMTTDNQLIKHRTPMLSIKHSYDATEGKKWLEKLLKLDQVVVSSKLDGLALSLVYDQGSFVYGALRGDGFFGENITKFLLLNKCCPIFIKKKQLTEVRGELCAPKGFDRAKLAGAVRKKEPEIIKNVRFYAYELMGAEFFKEGLKELEKEFFIVPNKFTQKIIYEIESPVDADGVVYRLNNNNKSIALGRRERYYCGRFSLKKASKGKKAIIEKIKWNVNKNGKLIPVAYLKPVKLNHILVNKVNIFNKRYLQLNNIGPKTEITISRVGNSAPQIINILKSSVYITPNICQCGSKLKEEEIHFACSNKNCKFTNYLKILYFMQSLKIKGLGIKSIIREYQGDFFQSIKHFFNYTWAKDVKDYKIIEYMKKLTISNLDLLYALGIPKISRSSLKNIFSKKLTSGIKYETYCVFLQKNQKLIEDLKDILPMIV